MFRKSKEKKQEEQENERLEQERKIEYLLERNRCKESAIEFLLTTSADNYVRSIGKELSDYDLMYVDAAISGNHQFLVDRNKDLEETLWDGKIEIVEKGKDMGAEVITDVRLVMTWGKSTHLPYYINGTALIPKQQGYLGPNPLLKDEG